MTQINVQKMTCARIPTDVGEFQLCYYANNQDEKEHLALVFGDIQSRPDVLTRIHSECFTGDVLGSVRCDCGPQLQKSMQMIAAEGRGVLIYLRQEGRGIGLLDKLRAYNLQDMGYDTVDANLMLGHQADARDYTVAACILQDLGVTSVRLLTNNPAKIEGLEQLGIKIAARVPVQTAVHAENEAYLTTKVERMRHLLHIGRTENGTAHNHTVTEPHTPNGRILSDFTHAPPHKNSNRPAITLSYAQSLDGSITVQRGQPAAISGPHSLKFTHQLRAAHDAILVGIGTVLADDPRLTVRLADGKNPQPIVLDTHLQLPLHARLLQNKQPPWIAAGETANCHKQAALEAAGARVWRFPLNHQGQVNLHAVLAKLAAEQIETVMVEGGATVITNFLAAQLVDRVILTVAPRFIGGLNAIGSLLPNGRSQPQLHNPYTTWMGRDMVLFGDVVWPDAAG